jgi:hypothetical protein
MQWFNIDLRNGSARFINLTPPGHVIVRGVAESPSPFVERDLGRGKLLPFKLSIRGTLQARGTDSYPFLGNQLS